MNPNKEEYTWEKASNNNNKLKMSAMRINYIFASKKMKK